MKTYEVELEYTAYVTVTVLARTRMKLRQWRQGRLKHRRQMVVSVLSQSKKSLIKE